MATPLRFPARQLVVGAAIVDDLHRPATLLAARRTEPEWLRGGWELPGGKVEPGETTDVALHREIKEELGVSIELGPRLPGPEPDGGWPLGERYVLHVRLVRVVAGVARPLEDHDELRILSAAELDTVGWLPADLPVVAAVRALMT